MSTLKISAHGKKYQRKRQWGTETRFEPLSHLHEKPSTIQLAWSRLAIVLTVVFWLLYITSVVLRQTTDGPQSYHFRMEAVSYSFVVTLLTFSALMYLVARQGALQRFSKHIRVPRAVLEKHFATHQPAINLQLQLM